MRFGRAKLARVLMVAGVLMALTMPGTIVLAHDGGGHGGHDAANGGHGDVDKGGGGGGGAEVGSHKETTSPDAGKNGDTMGDLKSNMHTGAKGRGAGGDDKLELGARSTGVSKGAAAPRTAEVGTVSRAVAPAHPAAVSEASRSSSVAATPGAAGVEAAPAGAAAGAPGAAAAGAPGGGGAPGAAAVAPPTVPPLGAEQTALGPTAPGGQRMVLGAQQTRPRTLPFTGLSAAWAMLISGGRWAGVLLGVLGLTFLIRGLRRG
jgi:hypothetical protein